EDLAAANLEVDVLERLEAARIALRKAADFDDRLRRHAESRARDASARAVRVSRVTADRSGSGGAGAPFSTESTRISNGGPSIGARGIGGPPASAPPPGPRSDSDRKCPQNPRLTAGCLPLTTVNCVTAPTRPARIGRLDPLMRTARTMSPAATTDPTLTSLAARLAAVLGGAAAAALLPAAGLHAQPSVAPPVEEVVVFGRATRLVGAAGAASEGRVAGADLAVRPLLRVAEVLEAVPGLIAAQHSGTGKANQYFL